MALIEEVNETNFEEKRIIGQREIQSKFDSFDKLRKYNIPIKEFNAHCSVLFKDPTVWAYATLKDDQGEPLKLWYYQDRFINDKNRFVFATASNQVGKTWAICVKALHHAIHVPNASVLIISKSEDQAIHVLDIIKKLINQARIPYQELVGEIENRTELHIEGPNKSESILRSFAPTSGVLGFPATLELCDEINFWEKNSDLTPTDYYDQMLEPRTNMAKNFTHPFLTMGQIVFISNPNGQQGLGWRSFNGDSRFNNYIFNWLACPRNSLEEYIEAKNRLPPHRFASIYAAQYVSVEGGFISLEQYEKFASYNSPLIIPPGSVVFLGGDFAGEDVKGKATDWNVLYGVIQIPNKHQPLFPRIQVVYHKRFSPGTKKSEIYDELEHLKGLCTIAKFAYDKVGVGDNVKSELIDRQIFIETQIESLTYSLPNKSEVYLNFQSLFQHGLIEGRDIPELKEQIMGLRVEQPEGSVHLKVHHKTEGVKDDEPDSLANACFAAKRLASPPVSAMWIPYKPPRTRPAVIV